MAAKSDTRRSLWSFRPPGLTPWEQFEHVMLLHLASLKLGIPRQDLVHWLSHKASQARVVHQLYTRCARVARVVCPDVHALCTLCAGG